MKLTLLWLTVFISCFSFAQITIEDLKVDTTITGFHFAADFQGTHVYTPNGRSDLGSTNPSAFSYTIAANMAMNVAIEEIEKLLAMSQTNNYVISKVVRKDTTLNGNKAFIISYTETLSANNYKNQVFNAVVMKDSTAIVFVSGDLDNGKYLEKIRKTFYATKW